MPSWIPEKKWLRVSLNELSMLAFISFLRRKNFTSDEQKWIHRNKERMERSKMSHCTTLHVSWKWNYAGLKFMFEEAFCVLRIRDELFFIFWLVVSHDWCVIWGRERCHFPQFCQLRSRNPPGATSIVPIFFGIISKCDPHRSRYQHTKFYTCMKNRTIFAICRSTDQIILSCN